MTRRIPRYATETEREQIERAVASGRLTHVAEGVSGNPHLLDWRSLRDLRAQTYQDWTPE